MSIISSSVWVGGGRWGEGSLIFCVSILFTTGWLAQEAAVKAHPTRLWLQDFKVSHGSIYSGL